MGSSPLMSLGIRAMAANYAALQTTGHNIANANVEGYSRQSAVMSTSKGQFTGAGFFGKGVDVTSVTRSHNAFLTRETANAKSLAAMDQARLLSLQRLEQVFQPGEAGLGHAASELFNAMVDLSSRPADLATRQVALARANDLAMRFSEAGTALDQAQATVTADLKASVAEVNQLTAAIAKANDQVAALRGSGQPANDVLDERDRLITQLSEKVMVSRIESADGSVAIFIGGGQRLVLGGEATEMRVVASDVDPSRSALAMRDGAVNRVLDDKVFGGGSLSGLLRFQNQDLVAARGFVGQLAAWPEPAAAGRQRAFAADVLPGAVAGAGAGRQCQGCVGPAHRQRRAHGHRPQRAAGQRVRLARKLHQPGQLAADAAVRRRHQHRQQRRRGRRHAHRREQPAAGRPLPAAARLARRQRHACAADEPAGPGCRCAAAGHTPQHQHRYRRSRRDGGHRLAPALPGRDRDDQLHTRRQ